MSRPKRLSESFIERVAVPGVYGDGRGGHGLQLRVFRTEAGHVTKRFRQQLRVEGRVTQIGVGLWPAVALQEARVQAMANRVTALRGGDPRRNVRRVAAPVAAPVEPVPVGPTFAEAGERVVALRRPSWKGVETEKKWRRALAAFPGEKPVGKISRRDILDAVSPVWNSKPSVGKTRLDVARAVMQWAISADYRGDDPTVAVAAGLPKQKRRTVHQPAMPVSEAPAAYAALSRCGRTGSRVRRSTALLARLKLLTAMRHIEVAGMRWSELDGETWTVPGKRMKAGEAHRVPLSPEAVAILTEAAKLSRRSGFVFPSTSKTGKPISRESVRALLKLCEISGTAHGWRSTFRNYCAEHGVSREVAEAALAHVVGGVEGAYFRTDLLDARREVMQAWADYIRRVDAPHGGH